MGVDIHGSVEFRNAYLDKGREWKDWWPVINAGILLDRSYEMFGSLFGVRNPTNFAPIAASRGLPDDVSEMVRQNAEWEGNHSFTWITWEELQAVNWEETGLIYETQQLSRRETLGSSMLLLMDMMKPLAEEKGGQCVRLVVWVDNYS